MSKTVAEEVKTVFNEDPEDEYPYMVPIKFREPFGPSTERKKKRRERKRRRHLSEIDERELWICPRNCGKAYKRTSTTSIRKHSGKCFHDGAPITREKVIRDIRNQGPKRQCTLRKEDSQAHEGKEDKRETKVLEKGFGMMKDESSQGMPFEEPVDFSEYQRERPEEHEDLEDSEDLEDLEDSTEGEIGSPYPPFITYPLFPKSKREEQDTEHNIKQEDESEDMQSFPVEVNISLHLSLQLSTA
jgi:hypothetical protein